MILWRDQSHLKKGKATSTLLMQGCAWPLVTHVVVKWHERTRVAVTSRSTLASTLLRFPREARKGIAEASDWGQSATVFCENKEIQPVHPKGDQFWAFIRRTDVETETPILWPPDMKSWLTGKDPDSGKDWRQEEKGTTEDEMVGWHYRLNGHEFEQTPGDS